MGAGTRSDYRLRLHGFPIRWQTRSEVATLDHRYGLFTDRVDFQGHTATGIRTPVSGLRIRRPSPLDDSGEGRAF
jgi:hypothetical protein